MTLEDFRRLASDDSLSEYERIGLPDACCAGFEPRIFDIAAKLSPLAGRLTGA